MERLDSGRFRGHRGRGELAGVGLNFSELCLYFILSIRKKQKGHDMDIIADRICRPEEVSPLFGRSLASIWRDQQAGKFPLYIKIGDHARGMRLSTLFKCMDSCETVSAGTVPPVAAGSRRGRKPSLPKDNI